MVVCGFSAAIFGELVTFRRDPGTHGTAAWGSAFGVLLFLALGSLIGAMAGLVTAISQISQRNERSWPRIIWVGIGIGILVCAIVHFSVANSETYGLLHEIFVNNWWATPIAYIFFGALGGYGCAMVAMFGTHSKQTKPRIRHQF